MLAAAITVRFLLQVILLLILGLWGFRLADNLGIGLLFGLGAAAAAALIWHLFISPSLRIELGRISRLVLELALFAAAAGALWQMQRPLIGMLLFAAACADRFALIWLHRRELKRRYSWR